MSSDHVKNFDTVIFPPKREKRLNLFGQIQRLFTYLTPPAIRAIASIPPAVRARTRLDRGVPLALCVAHGWLTGNEAVLSRCDNPLLLRSEHPVGP